MNEGISGNCLTLRGWGPSALARLDRDVLSQPDVRYLVVLEGINDIDIGTTAKPGATDSTISPQQLIFALNQLIDRAHAHGIKVIGATLPPFAGTSSYSANAEAVRQAENEFIRHSGRFDGVIDFDKVTRDPLSPLRYLPAYDSGDHLHPNDAGYKAMGESIDLGLFGQ